MVTDQSSAPKKPNELRTIFISVLGAVLATILINFGGSITEPIFAGSIVAHPDIYVSTFYAPLGITLHAIVLFLIFTSVYFYYKLKYLETQMKSIQSA